MNDTPASSSSSPRTPGRFGAARIRVRRTERYLKRRLAWSRLYRATSYAKSALWIVPLVAIALVLALVPALRALDGWLGWRAFGLDVAGAQALFQTVITLTLSFMVFTFGQLLVAIQIAGGQLTPRIIATTLLRNNVVRYGVGLFLFTLVFAVMSLNRLEKNVPELVTGMIAMLGIACMATFLFLIDHVSRLLRPVNILALVGNDGLAVIRSVYPVPPGASADIESRPFVPPGRPRRVVTHAGLSQVVLAVDLETLLDDAERADGIVEFVPQVGDFVAQDEPLFALYDGAAAIDDRRLRATVAFGIERTMEQDPMFAFRILVDIGIKALSPAINDPTTGVLAIDQVQRLLGAVGKRHLHGEVIVDDSRKPRVVYRTPNWEDYVHIACTELRAYGASNMQIARRLRAMIDLLLGSLPAHRHAALAAERSQLDAAIEKHYPVPEELALARIPDSQGLGGSSAASRSRV